MPVKRRPDDEVMEDAPTAQRRRIENFHWPSTLPYYQPGPMRVDYRIVGLSYVEKIASPIVQIRVGPEPKTFAVHKAILTEAAEYFSTMFNGKFKEAREGCGKFPKDDPDAWGLLIEWAYKGELPPLGRPTPDTKFTQEVTEQCWIRLKLCCLADKYRMHLLHNSALDSINSYLKWGPPGPKLTWEVFEKWCKYVYKNIPESNQGVGLRCYISTLFAFNLGFSMPECPDLLKDSSASRYSCSSLSDLAIEIPDLLRDVFSKVRSLESKGKISNAAPWDMNPCCFHIHNMPFCVRIDCAATLNLNFDLFDRDGRRTDLNLVQYFLQEMTLKGMVVCDIGDITRGLGMSRQRITAAVKKIIVEGGVSWVEKLHSVRLVPPAP